MSRWLLALALAVTSTCEAQVRAYEPQNGVRKPIKYSWDNTTITDCGAVLLCDITIGTLPPQARVLSALVQINGQGAGTATLTVSVGRVAATYTDYIPAADAKAAAGTVYGDTSAEIGSVLQQTCGDVRMVGTTDVKIQFLSTVQTLDAVTGSSGTVWVEYEVLP